MLETEIKRLSDNIEKLNLLLERMEIASKQEAETPSDENEQVEEAPGYTTDDIKSMALAISRKDRSKQKDIKAKLVEYDAKIASDLEGDALQKVGEWLAALKGEVGA